MNDNLKKQNIKDLLVYPLEIVKGKESTIYKVSKLGHPHHKNFDEIYCSQVSANKTRGWYRHDIEQNFSVINGSVLFVVYDERDDFDTKGNIVEIRLGEKNWFSLHLPKSLWYSFRAIGKEAYVMNLLPSCYESSKTDSLPLDSKLIPYIWGNYAQ